MDFLNNIYNTVTSIFSQNDEGIKTKSIQILNYLEENINDNVFPVIQQCEDKIALLKSRDSSKEFSIIKSSLKVSGVKDLIAKYKTYVTDVNTNIRTLQDSVNAIMTNTVNEKTMNYAQYSLFSSLETIAANIDVGLRIINHMLLNNKDTLTSTNEIKKMFDSLPLFKVEVIDNKRNVKQKVEDIKKLPKTNIFDVVNSNAPEATIKASLPDFKGFTGNPIYTFRKWLVRKDAEKLNRLEILKSEINNRILELEEEKAGASSENLETIRKQIEWYEEKRNKVDAEIQKIEND